MVRKMAVYTVKEEKIEVVKEEVKKFVNQIWQKEPDTFYKTYQTEKPEKFVHVIQFPDKQAEEMHSKASYTKEFVDSVYPDCIEGPVFYELFEIG